MYREIPIDIAAAVSAVNADLLIEQGADFYLRLPITLPPASSNHIFNDAVTISAVHMHVRQTVGSTTTLLTLSTPGGGGTLEKITVSGTGTDRLIVVDIPYTDLETITLLSNVPVIAPQQPQSERRAGTAVYDMEATFGARRWRVLEGNISVSRQVTRQS